MKFFRFNAGLAAILIAVAFAFRRVDDDQRRSAAPALVALVDRRGGGRGLLGDRRPDAGVDPAGDRRRPRALRRSWRRSCCRRSTSPPAGRSSSRALAVASFLSSAALLGGACTAMILGHWYLVIPSMQVSAPAVDRQGAHRLDGRPGGRRRGRHLRRHRRPGSRVWVRASSATSSRSAASSSGSGCCSASRPVLLAYLTWETAKIRSTQSATGILYVDFFTVVVGEVLAKYLLLATRVPV